MPVTRQFGISSIITQGQSEHLFVSVTDGFERGPGIQRDGLTAPRMTDPHSVAGIIEQRHLDGREWRTLPTTTNAYVQRVGTWTLYHHLKRFDERYGEKWRIVAVQSNGDLTMNSWHVAYINRTQFGQQPQLCALRTPNDREHEEPLGERTYRCLVKWGNQAAAALGVAYEFLDIRFDSVLDERWSVKIVDRNLDAIYGQKFGVIPRYNAETRDIGFLIDFALSGKQIVESGTDITPINAIDRFEDVRHVFNLPLEVPMHGHYQGQDVKHVNFGELQLFKDRNVRRGALFSPMVIPLHIGPHATVKREDVRAKLNERHYREIPDAPTRRGEFRFYPEDAVEIFFPHNVYPFGVLGLRTVKGAKGRLSEIVGLSSGGLSGRVGNTLEGTARIMFDFFGCTDAIVLDEGEDVFSIINPFKKGTPLYSNAQIIAKALHFTKKRVEEDCAKAAKSCSDYKFGPNMRKWPLNISLFKEMDQDASSSKLIPYEDIMVVPPQRSQIRSVLIFAVPRKK
jgi:hypothetical protein